jgi:hypothetical protein
VARTAGGDYTPWACSGLEGAPGRRVREPGSIAHESLVYTVKGVQLQTIPILKGPGLVTPGLQKRMGYRSVLLLLCLLAGVLALENEVDTHTNNSPAEVAEDGESG